MTFKLNPLARLAVAAVLSTVCVVAVAEVLARFIVYLAPPLQSMNVMFDEKYFVLEHIVPDDRPIIFFMGDSMMNRAIYPDLLQALLRKNGMDVQVVNLGIDGATPALSEELLKVAIKRRVIPALLFYDLNIPAPAYTQNLNNAKNIKNPQMFDPNVKQLNDSFMGRCLLRTHRDVLRNLLCSLEVKSILYRNRSYFKDKIRSFAGVVFDFNNFDQTIKKPVADYYPVASYMGWNPNPSIMTSEEFAKFDKLSQPFLETLNSLRAASPSFATQLKFERYSPLQNSCKDNSIRMALVWLPHYAPFFDDHLFSKPATDASISASLKATNDPKSNNYRVTMESINHDLIYFTDPWHMNTYGSIKTTRDFAELLSTAPFADILRESKTTRDKVR
jgi:hypothetical protein